MWDMNSANRAFHLFKDVPPYLNAQLGIAKKLEITFFFSALLKISTTQKKKPCSITRVDMPWALN
jgi:hypothetical protein